MKEDNKNKELYKRPPLSFENGIPIYVNSNEYIVNYEKIAEDVIKEYEISNENPFIPEDIWRSMEESTIKLIEKYISKDAKVLDVGVGMGRLLEHFPTLEKFGIDISLKMLMIAREKGVEVACALVEDMPYKENVFDMVICTDVFEHVIELNACCRNIYNVLKPGGTLIVRVPYKENLLNYTLDSYPYKYSHLRNFDENSLKLLLEHIFNMKIIEYNFSCYILSNYYVHKNFTVINKSGINKLRDLGKRLISGFLAIFMSFYKPGNIFEHFIIFLLKTKNRNIVFLLLEVAIFFDGEKSDGLYVYIMKKLYDIEPRLYNSFIELVQNPVEINVVARKQVD